MSVNMTKCQNGRYCLLLFKDNERIVNKLEIGSLWLQWLKMALVQNRNSIFNKSTHTN